MMQFESVYVRFFRSLNYDYIRASDPDHEPAPWDLAPSGATYPFVRVRLERDITTVVGANESGKSQLLKAISRALTGSGIRRGDFCRYSEFFTSDELTLPEFGARFTDLDDTDRTAIADVCEIKEPTSATAAALFRMNGTPKLRLYLLAGGAWTMHTVRKPALAGLDVPRIFEIDSKVPLPDAVPLGLLATGNMRKAASRDDRARRFSSLFEKFANWTPEAVTSNAASISAVMAEVPELDAVTQAKFRLADDLLIKVAGLERELFAEIQSAVAEEKHGYARSMIDTVNLRLAERLNLSKWWSQDKEFQLTVDLGEDELVFTITDRTDTSYSFNERSEGLKYFLSYFVQYLSHVPPADGEREILLMDEPDAFLSSSGQQDLMRIFEDFARPTQREAAPVQVVYVTHSPFLIDKNHAERIRVLEKGEHDEGTRVVANASRNHYEPLRSALGSFVGETAFIGTCNLLLEGPSDQILVAGMSSRLANRGNGLTERLDLNTITLVPAGGAQHVPYLAYLARGRDVDRPAVIVLLDGDASGDEARKALLEGRRVDPSFVLQINDPELAATATENPHGPCGIEDLVPLELAVAAVHRYIEDYAPDVDLAAFAPTAEAVFTEGRDTVKGLQAVLRETTGRPEFEINKVGFARSLLEILGRAEDTASTRTLDANFKVLLGRLARLQRDADRQASQRKIRSRINRIRRRFEANHPQSATGADVQVLEEDIERQLDDTREAEEVRAAMRAWSLDFQINREPREPVADYPAFLLSLRGLAYAGPRAVQTPGDEVVREGGPDDRGPAAAPSRALADDA